MKKYTFLYSIIAVGSLYANDSNQSEFKNGDIIGTVSENLVTKEDEILIQAREKFSQILELIQNAVPVGGETIAAKDEPLYKLCMYALVLLKKAPVSMSAPEKLHWSRCAIHTVGKKIRKISEHPSLVLHITAIEKHLIYHTKAILEDLRGIEDESDQQ